MLLLLYWPAAAHLCRRQGQREVDQSHDLFVNPEAIINTVFSSFSTRQAQSATEGSSHDLEPVSLFHPEAGKAESIIRNAWADSHLVAD